MEGKVNGWTYYQNEFGEIIAYCSNTEKLVFKSEESFDEWLELEMLEDF